VVTIAISLAFGIGLFFLAPAAVRPGIRVLLNKTSLPWGAWWGNFIEGVIRLLLLVGYIWAIGRIPDIARVFAYHGAEHKTINAYEGRAELTPENVARFPLEHPRCGTSARGSAVSVSA
jgi:uncharacterized protein YqhQ